MLQKIISGGQTGVDRAALDIAIELKIKHEGWCPIERVAEDGIIAIKHQLKTPFFECSSFIIADVYMERTILNIRDTDATLILSPTIPLSTTITDGTNFTISEVKKLDKPYLIVEISSANALKDISNWLANYSHKLLNIARNESWCYTCWRCRWECLNLFIWLFQINSGKRSGGRGAKKRERE